jgi:hypothetical protein
MRMQMMPVLHIACCGVCRIQDEQRRIRQATLESRADMEATVGERAAAAKSFVAVPEAVLQ